MERATFNYIAKVLRDYPHLDQYIHEREQELQAPWREHDENIGGGKATMSNGQERMAITIADDRRLNNLRDRKKNVEHCLSLSDEVTRQVIKELYFVERPELTVHGVAEKAHADDTTVRRWRQHFFELMADELGL